MRNREVYERDRKIAWAPNLFAYESVKADHEKRIDLMIRTAWGALKEARLPKKDITLFPHLKEVMIPDWICEKEGLV
ncbi:MAG: hypothetical protein ABIG11_00930 [bacterium]